MNNGIIAHIRAKTIQLLNQGPLRGFELLCRDGRGSLALLKEETEKLREELGE